MSKQVNPPAIIQKRVIQINHALSGVFGSQLQQQAYQIMQSRKQIVKRLQRKKKHSNILHDELYQYLEKFPEQRSNLQQQVSTTKKNPIFDLEEKQKYEVPYVELKMEEAKFVKEGMSRLEELGKYLGRSTLDINKLIEE